MTPAHTSDDPVGAVIHHSLGPYELAVSTRFGPRIVGLARRGGAEIFASLPDDVTLPFGASRFHFRGGHRVWCAPEIPEITYAPDDHACDVTATDGEIRIDAPVDAAGFAKSIRMNSHDDRIEVEHRLHWTGDHRIRAAVWAITQLPLGGTAILPLNGSPLSTTGQADRSLVLWPYTRLDDPRISWLHKTVIVSAASGDPLKLGSGPNPRTIGYLKGHNLFIKTVIPQGDDSYPDRGAVAQVFVNERFCELETVGSLRELAPGDIISHRESWLVLDCADPETAVDIVSLGEAV